MAQRHDEPARAVWPPEPGWFKLKLVKDGWAVPCQIVHDAATGEWRAWLNGVELPGHADPAYASEVARIWHYGTGITRDQYGALNLLRVIAPRDHPAANPTRPIDHRKLKPIRITGEL